MIKYRDNKNDFIRENLENDDLSKLEVNNF